MAHPNAELAKKAGDKLAAGDIQGFLQFHSDDVVMHVPGRNPLSGDYEGKDAFGKLFQQQFEILDGPPQIEFHDILAGDDHVAVLAKQTFTRGGKSFSTPAVVLLHLKDGKITEAWLHPLDQYGADEFWS
jgi:ketosteroid isomerase-like protein